MNSQPACVLLSTVMLLLLNSSKQLNAYPVLPCSQITYSPKENSLYTSYSLDYLELFRTATSLKDTEAIKYYCTNYLILSTINMEMPNLPRPVSCNTVTYNQILSNYTLEGLNRILDENSTVTTCKYYEEIKAYQYKLHKFFTSQNTSNTTIASITYLLQSAAESLQAIQYSNDQTFCTDFVEQEQEEVYDALVANNHDSIEAVLSCFKQRKDWKINRKYPEVFKTSPCVNYNDEKCQLYTSLYVHI